MKGLVSTIDIRGQYPHSTYIFKHALTREVVYDSVLTARRKRLHVDIGDAIEEIYRDNLDGYYEALAGHYVTGENHDKGAEYCRLAGRKGERAASFSDAVLYGKKRVACLERLPMTGDVEMRLIDARTTLGSYYNQAGFIVEAKECVEPILALALEHDYRRRIAEIYSILGFHSNWVEEDLPKAIGYLEKALEIAEESSDRVSLVMANQGLALTLRVDGEFDTALSCLEKALVINVEANSLWGISVMKSMVAVTHLEQGNVGLGYGTATEAVRIAEESGDSYSKGYAYTSYGKACSLKGFLEEAVEYLSEAIRLWERLDMFSMGGNAHMNLGRTYFDMGDYQKSQDCYDKGAWLFECAKHGPTLGYVCQIGSAMAKVAKGEREISLGGLYDRADGIRYRAFDAEVARCMGRILMHIDDHHLKESENWINKAIEANNRNSVVSELGSDYALYAELLQRKSDIPGAKEKLNTAIEILKECGADGWVKKYQEELAKI